MGRTVRSGRSERIRCTNLPLPAADVRDGSAYTGQLLHDQPGKAVPLGLPLVQGLAGRQVPAGAVCLGGEQVSVGDRGSFVGWVDIAAPWA